MMGLLDGKVAVVTGGGRGIGCAEARQLAAEGARVVVNDLGGSLRGGGPGAGADAAPAQQIVDEIRAGGGEAVANTDDVADWAGAKRLIDQAIGAYGRLDIVVNNAGVIRTGMSFNLGESDWDTVIRVHLKGTFAMSRFAGEYWRARSKAEGVPVDAAIVNTSSPNGLNGGMPGHVNYAVAKSGIATMTIVLARELAPYGVRVNAIAPVAMTRMTEELVQSGRFGEADQHAYTAESVAAVVGWLASGLSRDVSGQILAVAGGACRLWEGWRVAAEAHSDGNWTIGKLQAAKGDLFAGRDPGVPAMV
jgi:NAD(P)-dependent dehydrogenase (short-subunit alcohol dehydrogenase family)